jgi:RNA polymerase sigma-70 factor (ECF subfamily)
MQLNEEKELLDRIKASPEEFAVLFDFFYKKIFGYIFRRVTDYDASRDIAAETFLKAFLKINSFRWKGVSISSWLFRIATNEINQYFRKQNYSPRSLNELVENYHLDFANRQTWEEEKQELEKELSDHKEFLQIQQHLKTMDLKYQEVISFRYFESKSIKEIAEITGKNEGTIKSLLSRGIEKLRQMM